MAGTIVVSPDKFKGSLSAPQVARAVADAFARVSPDVVVHQAPLADGGEGTVDLVLSGGGDAVHVGVCGPLEDRVTATYAVRDGIAVIEMASAAGLGLLVGSPDAETALAATTFGVGELIRHAVESGVKSVVLGLGGSATTDGGVGLAAALGASVKTAAGDSPQPGGAGLEFITAVDFAPMIRLLAGVQITLATDVDNPLLGRDGSARIYGPQKGADEEAVEQLERGLGVWAELVSSGRVDASALPGAGAAGGAGFVLMAAVGARAVSGVELVMQLTSFEASLESASLLVVGEGSLDQQSLRGKGPVGAARVARTRGVEVAALVGRNALSDRELEEACIDRVYALTDREPDTSVCIERADEILSLVADDLALSESNRWSN